MIVVCKKYYIDILVKELEINNVNRNNPTYITVDDSKETIVKSHNHFITSVGLEMSDRMRKIKVCHISTGLQYKRRFIAGSSKFTTKDLSCLLNKLLGTIKGGLVRYCTTKTSSNGVNNL